MSDKRPIGVFDSGLGGLTAVKELLRLLPGEDIVYFGDTARNPYGVRSKDTIIRFTQQDVQFLADQDVKMVLAACGTVSSNFPAQLADGLPVPYVGVIDPTVQATLAATRTGRIGVIGTPATIRSGSFLKAITALRPDAQVISNGCPALVPLVEGGHIQQDDLVTIAVARDYLQPILAAKVDTLVLACTHFPIISKIIAPIMGPDVTLIDSGAEAAGSLARTLAQRNMLAPDTGRKGTARFYVSGPPENFGRLASIFLETKAKLTVEQVDIESVVVP